MVGSPLGAILLLLVAQAEAATAQDPPAEAPGSEAPASDAPTSDAPTSEAPPAGEPLPAVPVPAVPAVPIEADGPDGPDGPVGTNAPATPDPLAADADGTDDGARIVLRDPNKHDYLFLVIPILSFNSDEGVGGGAIFALHHFHGGVVPLRDDFSLRLFVTSQLVQRHEIRWEGLEVLDLPLRMWVRLGFFSTLTQPFCGYGMGVTCDEGVAERQAFDRNLEEDTDPFNDFVRRYYQLRYIRPHGDVIVRWRLRDKPHRVELLGGYRLAWYYSGSFFEEGPYAGSLYSKIFPEGEEGFASTPQLGFTVDNRDFEPAPTSGYFFEASIRGGHPAWGSDWQWAGMNASFHGYDRLLESPQVVYAGRILVDLADGDMHTEEMAEIGGTRDYGAFGGQWIGRGVRDRRYNGKLKVIHQSELRADLFDFEVFNIRFDVGTALFADLGWIGFDKDNIRGDFPPVSLADGPADPWPPGHPLGIVWGAGIGLRVMMNRAIVARFEMTGSPLEERSPSFYTPVGNSL